MNSFDKSCLKMGQFLEIEEFGSKYWQFCWESARSESIFITELIGKDAAGRSDNVSTDDPKNEFDV